MKWIQLVEAVEAKDGKAPDKWLVRLIKPGVSKNGNNYPKEVLAKSVSLFEGIRALARSDEDHGRNTNKRVRDIAGWFTEPRLDTDGSVLAVFNISEAAGWLRTMIADGWNRGKKDLVGFSIVADALVTGRRTARGYVKDVREIKEAHFVDVIVNPAAGGEIVSLAEAENPAAGRQDMNLEKLLKLIEARAPEEYKKLDLDNIDIDEVTRIVEALMDAKPKEESKGDQGEKKTPVAEAAGQDQLKGLTADGIRKMIAEAHDNRDEQPNNTRDYFGHNHTNERWTD